MQTPFKIKLDVRDFGKKRETSNGHKETDGMEHVLDHDDCDAQQVACSFKK